MASVANVFTVPRRSASAGLERGGDASASLIVKRGVDIVGSLLLLLLIAPLMFVVALLIWALDPGPLVYAQERIGKDGQPFPCLKLRTMIVGADEALLKVLNEDPEALLEWQTLHKLKCDPRVTRLGRFLRISSIDELPQLINVLRGDMSLVGPRPIVSAEAWRYGRYLQNYCVVKPGITGLWQISGRNDTTYKRRVALDVIYARRSSFTFDLRLLALTIPALFRREGCY